MDVLTSGRIRFTQPEGLNDLFESLPSFDGFKYGSVIEDAEALFGSRFPPEDKAKLDAMLPGMFQKAIGGHALFLSLTRQRNNAMMWAHYAKGHRGFVIGFDADHDFFRPEFGKALEGLTPVVYSPDRQKMTADGYAGLTDQDKRGLVLRKSADWSYEEELRLIMHPNHAVERKQVNGEPVFLFEFPPEILREVIFGFRMARELRQTVADVVASRYRLAELYEAVPHPTEYRLDVRAVPGRA